jgi:hypothetical protein
VASRVSLKEETGADWAFHGFTLVMFGEVFPRTFDALNTHITVFRRVGLTRITGQRPDQNQDRMGRRHQGLSTDGGKGGPCSLPSYSLGFWKMSPYWRWKPYSMMLAAEELGQI